MVARDLKTVGTNSHQSYLSKFEITLLMSLLFLWTLVGVTKENSVRHEGVIKKRIAYGLEPILCLFHFYQVLLLSQDYGKHLLGVEDLLQKHALVEADIAIQAERVRGVNASAQKFATDGEGN